MSGFLDWFCFIWMDLFIYRNGTYVTRVFWNWILYRNILVLSCTEWGLVKCLHNMLVAAYSYSSHKYDSIYGLGGRLESRVFLLYQWKSEKIFCGTKPFYLLIITINSVVALVAIVPQIWSTVILITIIEVNIVWDDYYVTKNKVEFRIWSQLKLHLNQHSESCN